MSWMRIKILLVGYTDTYVLPLCAAMLRSMCRKKKMNGVTIKTCGFWSVGRRLPDPYIMTVAAEMGLDLSEYYSTYIGERLTNEADWIIPQDDTIKRGLRSFLNRDTSKLGKKIKIHYRGNLDIDDCREIRQEVYDYCNRLMRKLSDLQRSENKFLKEVEYRLVQPDHAKQVAALEEKCFSHPWSLQAVLSELEKENSFFMGAFWRDRLVGYGSLYFAGDVAYINNIAVDPAYRTRGIGECLLYGLERFCRGKEEIDELTLEVRSHNDPAINLYRKRGFSVTGVRENFYRDPQDDALIMTKKTRT